MKRMSDRKTNKRRLSLLSFLRGRVTLSCAGADSAALLTIMMRYALVYGNFHPTEDGGFTCTASYGMADRIVRIARHHGIAVRVLRREGILQALLFCMRRPGIPVGLLLGAWLLVAASGRLWEIRVTGNSSLSGTEVIRELHAAGLSLGDRIADLDVDSIENRLLRSSDRISWITVNLIGTVAEVQIREKLLPDKAEPDRSPADLVARCDGVIVGCEIERGNLLVKDGMAVRAGEVLVSGIYGEADSALRFTHAAGVIYAETAHTFEICVPYRHEITVMDGTEKTGYSLLFFGRTIPLSELSADMEATGAVERISYLTVFGKEIPIGLMRETVQEYRTEEAYYTPERAMEIAYYRLSEEIAAIPGMQGLLSKSIVAEVTEEAYILRCSISCIENIAQTKTIEVELFD